MFSQSCSLLQNKNQSPLPRPLSHNLTLLATRSYTSSTKTFMDIKPVQDLKPRSLERNQSKSNMNLLGFVYGISNSRPTQNSPDNNLHHSDMENLNLKSLKLKNHCKELIETPTMPVTPSYLVGGFVGSKSQLGCRSHQSFYLNMWDLIENLGLADILNSNPCLDNQKTVEKQNSLGKSMLSSLEMENTTSESTTNLCHPIECPYVKKEVFVSKKQSYAEVAKTNLDPPMVSCYQSPSSVIGTSIKSDRNDTLQNNKLPNMCPKEGLTLPTILPYVTLASSNQNNEQDEIRDVELNLPSQFMKESNITSSLTACKESQTSSSNNANGQIENSDVTCCQTLSEPTTRLISVIEVNKNESKVLTLDHQILPSTSLSNILESKKANCENVYSPNPTVKGILKKTNLQQNRNRIVSQCSDDSEDSFVVFEQSEDDTSDYSDNDDDSDDETNDSSCCESDEDSLLATKDSCDCEMGRPYSPSTVEQIPPPTPSHRKRVRFAEGADLVQVVEVERSEAEGRAEWEMHALDCWRFRQRIQLVEPCLQLVLDPAHRQRIYQQRFLPQD